MNQKKEFAAYLTIEISLLFPIILSILISIIFLIFYAYNSTIAFQNAAICALYGKEFSYKDTKVSEQIDRMYTVLETLNKDQYIATNQLKQKVSVEGNSIVVSQKGNVNIPLLISGFMSEYDFSEGVKVQCQEAVFYIRQMRKGKNNEN